MEQTAVEWFAQKLSEQGIDYPLQEFNQAKEMEKKEELQQWIEIWSLGYNSGWDNCMKKHERNKSE